MQDMTSQPPRPAKRDSSPGPGTSSAGLLFLREEELRLAQDILFFALRDLSASADAILAELGYGRAHHRTLHWIARRPGLKVGELLGILGITKQSLTRVLGPLIRQGFVAQTPGQLDRRQRLLSLHCHRDQRCGNLRTSVARRNGDVQRRIQRSAGGYCDVQRLRNNLSRADCNRRL